MKFIKGFVFALLAVVLSFVAVGGYLGVIPGVSTVFGSNKPKDLGVQASQENFDAANSKIKLVRQTGFSSGTGFSYQGSHAVDVTMTSEEMTSLMQKGSYVYNPIAQDFQMKIHDDGVVEISGILNLEKLKQYAKDAHLGNVDAYAKDYPFLNSSLPFYMSGSGGISDNKSDLKITTLTFGKFSVPVNDSVMSAANGIINSRLSSISGLSIKSLNFGQGAMHLVGNVPDTLKVGN